jgi:hypothetical protein
MDVTPQTIKEFFRVSSNITELGLQARSLLPTQEYFSSNITELGLQARSLLPTQEHFSSRITELGLQARSLLPTQEHFSSNIAELGLQARSLLTQEHFSSKITELGLQARSLLTRALRSTGVDWSTFHLYEPEPNTVEMLARSPAFSALRSIFASCIFYGEKAVHRIYTKPISSILAILFARWIFKSIRYLLAPEPEDQDFYYQEHHCQWKANVRDLQYQIAELTYQNAQLRAAHTPRMITERELSHKIGLLRNEVYALKRANQEFQTEIKQVSFYPPMACPIL